MTKITENESCGRCRKLLNGDSVRNKDYFNRKQRITLPMILDQFIEEGRGLIWSILDLDLLGDFEPGEYYNRIIMHVWEGKNPPVFLTWDELYEMANKLTVIIELKLIGCKDKKTILEINETFKEPLDTYPQPSDIKPLYEVLVDIDDGELRAVLAKKQAIVERCFKEFGPYPVGVYRDITDEHEERWNWYLKRLDQNHE